MRKKGMMADLMFFGVFCTIFIIIILVGGKMLDSYNDKYQAMNTSSTGIGQDMLDTQNDRYSSIFDWIFLSVVVFFVIGLIISFSLIDAHPAMFFIVFILFIFIIIVMGILGQVFEEFSSDSAMAETAAGFPMTGFIMENWVIFSVVLGMVALGVLFAKLRGAA